MQIKFNSAENSYLLNRAYEKHKEFISKEMLHLESIHHAMSARSKVGKEIVDIIFSGEKVCPAEDLYLTHPARYKAFNHIYLSSALIGLDNIAVIIAGALEAIPLHCIMMNHSLVSQNEDGSDSHDLHIFSLYHYYRKSPSFHFDDKIIASLEKTDISKNIPAYFINPTMKAFYMSFGRNCSINITNQVSGKHTLEGAYVSVAEIDADHFTEKGREFANATPDSQFIALDVMFTGRPKDFPVNDNTIYTTFYFDINSERSIPEQLQSNKDYCTFNLQRNNATPEFIRLFTGEMVDSFGLMLTSLIYLNCADVRRTFIDQRADIEKKLSVIKNPKKTKRLKAELRKAETFTLITSDAPSTTFSDDENNHAGGKKPHYRRGFLRAQKHGKNYSLIKIIKIEPVLVNRSFLGKGEVPIKDFKVR